MSVAEYCGFRSGADFSATLRCAVLGEDADHQVFPGHIGMGLVISTLEAAACSVGES